MLSFHLVNLEFQKSFLVSLLAEAVSRNQISSPEWGKTLAIGRVGCSESRSGSRHCLMTSALLEPVPITTTHLVEEGKERMIGRVLVYATDSWWYRFLLLLAYAVWLSFQSMLATEVYSIDFLRQKMKFKSY